MGLAGRETLAEFYDVHVIDYPDQEKHFSGSLEISSLALHAVSNLSRRSGSRLILFGFSYGARVAYEAAGILASQGIEIDLLIIGDIAVQYRPNSAKALKRWAGQKSIVARIIRFDSQSALDFLVRMDEQNPAVPDHILIRLHNAVDSLPDSIRFKIRVQIVTKSAILRRKVMRWKPKPYAGDTLLLLTRENCQINSDILPDMGWGALCPNLFVAEISGGHGNCLLPHNLPSIITAINRALSGERMQ